MAIRRPNLLGLTLAGLAFLAALAVFALVNASPPPAPSSAGTAGDTLARDARTTPERIAALQAALRDDPGDAGANAALGGAYLQRVRETGDASLYDRAQTVLRRAVAGEPRNLDALVGLGTLALARHDFRAGLSYGLAARRAEPGLVLPYAVVVDALIELGRYDEAERTLQRMIDLKPTQAGYARVSYFRELSGDLPGAADAMGLAISAGGSAPENGAYLQTQLANLELTRGRLDAAERELRGALAQVPGYVPAQAALGRLAAMRGDTGAAIAQLRDASQRLPLPEYVVALGETELAAGQRAQGLRDLELVRAQQRLLGAGGVNVDVEAALFEANHGTPTRAVPLARRAWTRGPSVRSADALGWALTRAGRPDAGWTWAQRALALGSADPAFLFHAGIAARDAGRPDDARRLLRRALARNPRFSPLDARSARAALEGLS